MEIWEVSLIPLRGTELLKEGDPECNNFGESNKVMNVPFIIDDQNIFVKLYWTKMEISITT